MYISFRKPNHIIFNAPIDCNLLFHRNEETILLLFITLDSKHIYFFAMAHFFLKNDRE